MKLLTFLIITASLVTGTLSAASAYLPRLEAVDGSMGLTLNAEAGVDPEDASKPLLDPAASEDPIKLTDELIGQLSASGIERVRVKEFGFSRWDGRWWFILSCLGLILGAGLIRFHAARTLAARLATDRHPHETPEHALRNAHDQVRDLRQAVTAAASDEARTQLIVETLDDVQRTHLNVVSDATAELIARLGAAGYAQLMDRFAAAERQLNRAWSAAADGVIEEALVSLEQGEALLEEATERMTP